MEQKILLGCYMCLHTERLAEDRLQVGSQGYAAIIGCSGCTNRMHSERSLMPEDLSCSDGSLTREEARRILIGRKQELFEEIAERQKNLEQIELALTEL